MRCDRQFGAPLRGMSSTDLVIEITQRRDGYFDEDEQKRMEALPANGRAARTRPDFYYRAGATILVDPATSEVRRVIRTPGTIADTAELDGVRDFLSAGGGLGNAFDGLAPSLRRRAYGSREEPFALLHQLEDER